MPSTPKITLDYRKTLLKGGRIIVENSVIVLSGTILLVGLFMLQRINTQTSPVLDQSYLSKQVTELKKVEFDQEAVEQIEKLDDTTINITSEFTDRNNPFKDN